MAEAAYEPHATLCCMVLAAAGSRRRYRPEDFNPYTPPKPLKRVTATEFFRGIAIPAPQEKAMSAPVRTLSIAIDNDSRFTASLPAEIVEAFVDAAFSLQRMFTYGECKPDDVAAIDRIAAFLRGKTRDGRVIAPSFTFEAAKCITPPAEAATPPLLSVDAIAADGHARWLASGDRSGSPFCKPWAALGRRDRWQISRATADALSAAQMAGFNIRYDDEYGPGGSLDPVLEEGVPTPGAGTLEQIPY